MPKDTRLYNQHIGVERGQEIDQEASTPDNLVMRDIWTLVLTDKIYGDRVLMPMGQEARDSLVRKLTGDVHLASSDLSKL